MRWNFVLFYLNKNKIKVKIKIAFQNVRRSKILCHRASSKIRHIRRITFEKEKCAKYEKHVRNQYRYLSCVSRVRSRPTSGTQLCSSCMINARQNQWVQSWTYWNHVRVSTDVLKHLGFDVEFLELNWHLGTTCRSHGPDGHRFSFSHPVFMTFLPSRSSFLFSFHWLNCTTFWNFSVGLGYLPIGRVLATTC